MPGAACRDIASTGSWGVLAAETDGVPIRRAAHRARPAAAPAYGTFDAALYIEYVGVQRTIRGRWLAVSDLN